MEFPEQIQKFKEIDANMLLNPDFGSKNFSEIKPIFDESYSLINEMIDIAYGSENFPEGLKGQILQIVTQFNGFYNQIVNYSIDKDGSQQFRGHQNIINDFKNWYDWNYQGFDKQNKPRNFFTIYNACKNLSNQTLSKDQEKLRKYIDEAEKAKKDIHIILSELRKKAGDETVVDYANIFKQQAERYSFYKLSLRPFRFKVGAAEIWLFISLLSGIGLIIAINFIAHIFPLNPSDPIEIKIILLVTRFAFISFLIFLVTFFFRQYSISKHLYTLNKHRQNTLDSYKLFLQSVGRDDTTTRNALMMEVAKAIYEAGNTGYISSKNDYTTPSVIEMTRLINEQK